MASKATTPASRASAIQACERRQVADAGIGVDVDLRRPPRPRRAMRPARTGVRRLPRLRGGGAAAPPGGGAARRLPAARRQRQFRLRLERDAGSADIRPMRVGASSTFTGSRHRSPPASVPVASATRRVSVVNSIVLRKAISFGPLGGCSAKSSSPSVDRHVVLQRHQLARNARLVGIGDDRLAALVLLDLGRRAPAACRGRRRSRAAARPSSGRCRECPARCRRSRRSSPAGRSSFRAARPISRSPRECRCGGPSSGRTSSTVGPTSCIRSLSDETIVVSAPASQASRA